MKRLENKRCLVTGAARGIGEAIAAASISEGAEVILSDIDVEAVKQTAQKHSGTACHLDVADEAHWEALAKDYPEIDVVVNNAGITGFEDSPAAQDPEHAALKDWQRVHRINTDGTFLGCRYVIRAMRKAEAGFNYQYLLALRSGRDSGGGRLCRVQSRDPQSFQNSCALLCAKRAEHSL